MNPAAPSLSATAPLASPVAESRVDLRQALWMLGRALAYVKPFKGRFLRQMGFTVISVLPVLFVPWPLKMLTDNVMRATRSRPRPSASIRPICSGRRGCCKEPLRSRSPWRWS